MMLRGELAIWRKTYIKYVIIKKMMSEKDKIEFKEKLSEFKDALDKKLKAYFDKKIQESEAVNNETTQLLEKIADLTLRGGKRIRAALLYYSYLGHGGRKKEEALSASMSVELSETYMLIHDDIIDRDTLRRGGQTIHDFYEKRPNGVADKRHYGTSIALIAGNMACAMSNEILLERNLKPKLVKDAVLELNKTYLQVGFGQLLDFVKASSSDVTESEIIQIHRYKTAPYTFEGPIKIGAILAGAKSGRINDIDKYAVDLGIAYQLQDDILGIFGTEIKLGKPLASDFREGKKTLLLLDALSKSDERQREVLLRNTGIRNLNSEAIKKVLSETGALDRSIDKSKKMVNDAKTQIVKSRISKEAKQFFISVANYIVDRDH